MGINIEQRRKRRALEARRDQLLSTKQKAIQSLTVVRAELKSMQKKRSRL